MRLLSRFSIATRLIFLLAVSIGAVAATAQIGRLDRAAATAVIAGSLIAPIASYCVVARSIMKPLKDLAVAANVISQGNLDAETPVPLGANGEIGDLARSLHRMAEQFRAFIVLQKRSRDFFEIHAQLTRLKREAPDIKTALERAAELLCGYFEADGVSAVIDREDAGCVLSRFERERGLLQIDDAPALIYHAQIRALLTGKKIALLNAFALERQKIAFASDDVKSACFLPLRVDDRLEGYIILENARVDDAALIHCAETLSHALPAFAEDETEAVPEEIPTESALIMATRTIGGLDADGAIAAMGGLRDVYENTLRLFTDLLPASIQRLDDALQREIYAFAIEVHGIKGSLKNIGANDLGNVAGELEAAAKAGDAEACANGYPPFKQALRDFYAELAPLFKDEGTVKPGGDVSALQTALSEAAEACEGYDAQAAREKLAAFTAFSFGSNTDALLGEVVGLLQSFDCEKALETIGKMKKTIGD